MGILAGGDDQVHLWRQVLEQEGKRLVNGLGINDMVIIENEDETLQGWWRFH